MKIAPFSQDYIFKYLVELTNSVTGEIRALDNEYVLKASLTELDNYFVEKAKTRPITLKLDEYYSNPPKSVQMERTNDFQRGGLRGERVKVPATILKIEVPFEGDPILWHYKPSHFSLSDFPDIEVMKDRIVFDKIFFDDSANSEQLKSEINSIIKAIAVAIDNLRKDVDKHNDSVSKEVKEVLSHKRKLAQSVLGTVSALGIPIRRRDTPLTYVVPVTRRQSPLKKPAIEVKDFQREPVLEEEEYKHILNVMRSMSLVIERNPKAFATLDEEAIRTHFLLQLNGHYEGGATGETFNVAGKTDILIREDDRNVFIAECKFWTGPKGFDNAIDQLLGYLTWRDAKCALIVFNKNKDSAGVCKKMHEEMEKRSEHQKTISHDPKSDSRYIFVKESEPEREITITTQLYDVPLAEE